VTHYTREGRPVVAHHPHRAVVAPVAAFHLGSACTIHQMRDYVIERPDHDRHWRFWWPSYCGLHGLFIDADGRCRTPVSDGGAGPQCWRCQRCARLAEAEARSRKVVRRWKAMREG
jgi:hypothetical protein